MIYTECKPDSVLVKFLTNVPGKEIVHEQGKYNVCNRLERRGNCKGLVDEDPASTQHPYTAKINVLKELPEHDLKVLHDRSKNNYIIVLCPRLEEWILNVVKETGVDMKEYGLPDNAKKLHAHINISQDGFVRLLNDSKLKASSRLRALKKLLEQK